MLELLNDLLYRAQKDRRLDEAAAAELMAALRPLLGHTEPDRLVWDPPGKEREYLQCSQRLDWLRGHPLTQVEVSATLFRILGKVTDRDTTTVPVDLSFEPTPAAYRKRFGALCRPSWQWINAQPEVSLTRADKPVDEDGRIPYFFRGSAEAIEAPLLYGEWGLTPRQRRDARVMISRWLWDEVTWWKNPPVKKRRGQPADPAFLNVDVLTGPYSWPGGWIDKLVFDEISKPLWEARERQRRQEQEITDTERRLDYLVTTHRHAVPVEQTALLRFRHDLDRVVAALLDKPITVGQSKITNAEVVQSLQHLPRRQAYVRIGTAVHAMTARPPADRVDAEEGRRRVDQLREQTRRDLCRQVSSVAPDAAQDDPPARAARSEDEGPIAPRTAPLASGDAEAAPPARTTPPRRTGRIRRSRPLPER